MSDLGRLHNDISSLPEEAQQSVIDFVEFLKQKHQASQRKQPRPINFEKQPFVGMWCDRAEMKDSVAWVRQTRVQQWQK